MNSRAAILCLLAVGLVACGVQASIAREPVKVDRSNAGPKYDIDDAERTRVVAENPEANQVLSAPRPPAENERQEEGSRDPEAPMISIRRIFLVPMSSSPHQSSSGEDSDHPLRMLGMMPPRSMFNPFGPSRHLFGGDESSRPTPMKPEEGPEVMSASGNEQEPSNERPRPSTALLDPIELLMEAMRQALHPANMMPEPTDLNKDASSASGSGESKPVGSETGLESPTAEKKPQSFNTTKEDIVEIDGKKYLRKTIINRHVGEGIMFMTRRLIFSPLNETDTGDSSANPSSTTTTTTTTTTVEPSTEQSPRDEKIEKTSTEASPAPIEPVSTNEPVASETASSSEKPEPSTTTVANDKEDTTAKSLGERISESVSKVERLMEKIVERKDESTTTEKPSS